MERKTQIDLDALICFINTHEKCNNIKKMFKKGPDPKYGFMWTDNNWWTDEESNALRIISNKVLSLDWDSSGYGFMMRLVQRTILDFDSTNDSTDDSTNDSTTTNDGRQFAQAYLKTSLAMDMDDNNKKALKVASEKGFNTAATEMMKQAGGDYSRMRSMFG